MFGVIFILILFGLVIGSFLNVVIYRVVHGESFVGGRSHCPHCKKTIRWYDNIPLISYLVLHGRCRFCRKSISLQYPAVELLTATLFVWWYVIGFSFFQLTNQPFHVLQPLFWLFVGVCFVVIFFADLLYGIIPDLVVYPLTVISLLYRASLTLLGVMQLRDFETTLFASGMTAAVFYGLLLISRKIYGKDGFGRGDIKYAVPMGLLLGYPAIILGVFLAFVFGSAVGVALVLTKRKQLYQTMPFGPFLVLGTLVTLLFGERLIELYLQML